MTGLAGLHRELVAESTRPTVVLLLFLLAPLGWLYGIVGRVRRLVYAKGLARSYRAPVPVISVGNLAVGGTGKTPLVDLLVRHLLSRGRRVAVVSRGYKGETAAGVLPVTPTSDPAECGDEPLLLARRNPAAVVLVARQRKLGVEQAVLRHGAEIVILDDGFQHLPVARDLDIVLLDAGRPFGNGLPLPAGNLREFPAALRRADLLIWTRSRSAPPRLPWYAGPQLSSYHRLSEQAVRLDGAAVPLRQLQGAKIAAFAGIAHPERFFAALVEAGLNPVLRLPLPDHVAYDAGRLEMLRDAAKEADYLLTTEKDGVKLRQRDLAVPCLTVGMEVDFQGAEGAVFELVDNLEAQRHR